MNVQSGNYLVQDLPLQQDATILRRLTGDDLDVFSTYRSDMQLARYQGWEPMSRTDARSYLERASGARSFIDRKWIQLGIADGESDVLMGDIGVCLDVGQAQAEIGFTLSQQAQGRGHARRAVTMTCDYVLAVTEAQAVKGITDTRNAASIRLLEACGFTLAEEVDAIFKGEQCREAIYLFEAQ